MRLRPDRKKTRQDSAKERQSVWASFGPKKQLAELDRRLGPDVGAKKQRARLAAQLQS